MATARSAARDRAAHTLPNFVWDGGNANGRIHPYPLATERAADPPDTEPQADTAGRQPAQHKGDEADVP